MFSTIGCLIICGLVVAGFEKLFYKIVGGAFGYKTVMTTAIIGTPVHEAGHALMCLLFGHKIVEIKLYEPDTKTGTLGYVSHSFNPNNWYQKFGNLFIGLGPIFSGLGVITAIMFIAFPSSVNDFFHTSFKMVEEEESIFTVILSQLTLPIDMIAEDGNIFLKIIGFLLIFSIVMHINLSIPDIKGSISGLVVYAVIAAVFTGITALFGTDTVNSIRGGLHVFASYAFALFTLIYIFAVLIILISLLAVLIKKLIKR